PGRPSAWPTPYCASASTTSPARSCASPMRSKGWDRRSETILAGKTTELEAAIGALNGGDQSKLVPSIGTGGDDSKGSLARRIRSLQKRAARVSSAGGT